MKKLDINFKYNLDYDYDTYYSCSESGCDTDSICRCSTIDNAHVTDVYIDSLSKSIYDLYFDNSQAQLRDSKLNSVLFGVSEDLNLYCIDRVLRYHKVWDPDNWDIRVEGGYYGDEIGDIRLNNSDAIENNINQVLSLKTIKEKVEFLLNLEYGYLLPELEDVDYELVSIDIDDVVFGSDGHYRKIQKEDLSHYSYSKYNGIRGIVKRDSAKFKIIDGYHRMFSFKDTYMVIPKGRSKKSNKPSGQISVILVK